MLIDPTRIPHIPNSMRSLDQWMNWVLETRPNGTTTKRPIAAKTGKNGSSTNARTWCAFALALTKALERPELYGIGIAFTPPLVGIDLDHVKTGDVILPWAQTILDRFPETYTEISPSGTGFHLYVFGQLAKGFQITGEPGAPGGGVYSAGRYFTVTGERWGNGTDIQEVTADDLAWVEATIRQGAASKGNRAAVTPQRTTAAIVNVDELGIDDDNDGDPPADLLVPLLYSEGFADVWTRQRKMPGDQTASAYEMSIARRAHDAGWSPQHIYQLLRMFRRKDGLMEKNAATLKHTIGKVVADSAHDKALADPSTATPSTNLALVRERLLDLPLTHLIRHGQNPGHYVVYLENVPHGIHLHRLTNVQKQSTWQEIIAEHTHRYLPRQSPIRWERTLGLLMSIVEDVETADIGQFAETEAWITHYTHNLALSARASYDRIRQEGPFYDDEGRLYVHIGRFLEHLRIQSVNVERSTLVSRLSAMGWKSKQIVKRSDDGATLNRHYWMSATPFAPTPIQSEKD